MGITTVNLLNIQFVDLFGHYIPIVPIFDQAPGAFGYIFTEFLIIHKLFYLLGQILRIVNFTEKPGLSIFQEIRDSAYRGSNNWYPRGHRLQKGGTESF